MRGRGRSAAFGALLAILLASPSQAADTSPDVVGLGAYVSSRVYRDEEVSVIPVPVVVARRGRWFLEGIRGGYVLTEADVWRADAILAPHLGGVDPGDGPALAGMKEDDPTLEGGLRVRLSPWRDVPLAVSGEVLHDLLGEHGGALADLSLTYTHDRHWWSLAPSVSLRWRSARLADHLYGVDEGEIRAGRPAYAPGAETGYGAGLRGHLALSPEWLIFGLASYEHLGGDVGRSPIVANDDSLTGILGLGRIF